MKIAKSYLKSVIKECLLEILSEGLQESVNQFKKPISGMARSAAPPVLESSRKKFDPRLDTPIVSKTPRVDSRQEQANAIMKNSIKTVAGGNKIMESIFADTAATTYAAQVNHKDSSPVTEGVEQINGTPEEIFGEEMTNRWANLAFSPNANKKFA